MLSLWAHFVWPILVFILSYINLNTCSVMNIDAYARFQGVKIMVHGREIWSKPRVSLENGRNCLTLRGGNDEFICVVHDVGETEFTLAWSSVPGATKYQVQLQNSSEGDFLTLSSEFTTTMMRKKNLIPSTRYAHYQYAANHLNV